MSDVAAALFRRAVPGLVDRSSEQGGIRSLLAARNYAIDAISADVTRLDNIDVDTLLSCILFDYSRFALASLESYLVSSMSYYTPKAIAWPLVKVYYAAFYAGHAVLRATGTGIVRIDETLPNLITQVGRLYVDPNYTFVKGTYRYDIGGVGQQQMSLTLTRLDNGAAVHATFWDHFCKYFDDVARTGITNGEPAAAQVLARIDEFTRLLRLAGAGSSASRLSEFRNAVNYRHEHSAWFPFPTLGQTRETTRAIRLGGNANVRLDVKPDEKPITAFRQAAGYLSSVNYDLAELLISRSQVRRHEFVQNWSRLKRDAAS